MVDVAHPQSAELFAFATGKLEPERYAVVEAHVRECALCRAGLVTPTAATEGTRRVSGEWRATGGPSQTQPAAGEPSDMPELGSIVADKYRVEGLLGRGGMGVVLSAQHVELGHRVALKVLRSTHSQDVQRFLREAQTCVQLRGEHVVRVFDLGRLPAGSPYFVMELLLGEDLSRVLARGPLPLPAAIRCILEACAGLAEAHAAGIVHRDLKPANLFLEARGEVEPRLKVLDFGISKWLPQHQANQSVPIATMTFGDVVMGSMLYMSPEQLRASRDVDVRTDVWSLGVILYELLSGAPPFTAASPSAVAIRIATATPEPITVRVPGVPKQLEAIIARCLEKDREARYPTVTALADDLRRLVAAGDLNGLPTDRPKPRRLRVAAVVIASLIAAAVAVAVFLPTGAKDPTSHPGSSRSLETAPAAHSSNASAAINGERVAEQAEGAAAESGDVLSGHSAAERGGLPSAIGAEAAAARVQEAAAHSGTAAVVQGDGVNDERAASAQGERTPATRNGTDAAARDEGAAAPRGEGVAAAHGEGAAAARGESAAAAASAAAARREKAADVQVGRTSASRREGAAAPRGDGVAARGERGASRVAGARGGQGGGGSWGRRTGSSSDLDIGEVLPP